MDLFAQVSQWTELARSGEELTAWQSFAVDFYQAFIEANRRQQYLEVWEPRCLSRRWR